MCVAYSSGDHPVADRRRRSRGLRSQCSSTPLYETPMLFTVAAALLVLTEENQKPHSAQRPPSSTSPPS